MPNDRSFPSQRLARPALGLALAALMAPRALAFRLITPQEAAASAESAHLHGLMRGLTPQPLPTTLPRIDIVSPKLATDVHSPVTIQLKFVPAKGAVILPDTFRAYYGWLGIDITDRIREHAKITAAGLTADDAELPSGTHDLTLKIKDSEDHTFERSLSFTVE